MSAVLDEILKKARSGAKMLALFDLDSTLFDLRGRTGRICEAFASDPEMTSRFPQEIERLREIEFQRQDFGLREPMRRLGFLPESLVYQALHSFWRPRFFSNEYLHHDRPLDGAPEFVTALAQAGAEIRYISGRHVSGMLAGTVSSLITHGFPLSEDQIEICLKPEFDMDDAEFKAELIAELSQGHSEIWLFENEPANISFIARLLPNIKFVFLDTCHSGRQTISPQIPAIPNFKSSKL